MATISFIITVLKCLFFKELLPVYLYNKMFPLILGWFLTCTSQKYLMKYVNRKLIVSNSLYVTHGMQTGIFRHSKKIQYVLNKNICISENTGYISLLFCTCQPRKKYHWRIKCQILLILTNNCIMNTVYTSQDLHF